MGDTSIQWTNKTWNPTRGCSVVSPGCTHCYAMGQAHRFSGTGKPFEGLTKGRRSLGPVWTGKVRLAPEMLALPLTWRKPQRVFVNSMSDLFHEGLANEEIAAVFGVMAAAPRHTFQVLTKRSRRMREWFEWLERHSVSGDMGPNRAFGCAFTAGLMLKFHGHDTPKPLMDAAVLDRPWPLPNVWLGVSAEDQERADERIPELLRTPAAVRFVSYEPALGPVDFAAFIPPKLGTCADAEMGCGHSLANSDAALSWVIVGGESGPRARTFGVAWARSVVEQCKAAGVACFVKQLGAKPYESVSASTRGMGGVGLSLKSRKGDDMAEWPEDLRVRQFPEVRP